MQKNVEQCFKIHSNKLNVCMFCKMTTKSLKHCRSFHVGLKIKTALKFEEKNSKCWRKSQTMASACIKWKQIGFVHSFVHTYSTNKKCCISVQSTRCIWMLKSWQDKNCKIVSYRNFSFYFYLTKYFHVFHHLQIVFI
jgi:hypothetical protein